MIDTKDVIAMKVPYPSINSGMALLAHMYICRDHHENSYEFVKCQTLKPYMLTHNPMRHFIDEIPDITRIDCDKIFSTFSVSYADGMKTASRPDICDELYGSIEEQLVLDGYENNEVNEEMLKQLNPLIN